jgi:hypothetical protein
VSRMAKKSTNRSRTAPSKEEKKRPKRNKIHLSLFVDGQEVTLIDEFNTPVEAIAAAREFLDKHGPERAG